MGKTPAGLPTLKNKSPTFSALFTAEGNVFVHSFSVSIKLSTRLRSFFFFFLFVVSALFLFFLLF